MLKQKEFNWKVGILWSMLLASILVLAMLGPVQQKTDYHRFADVREMMGLPNALNVITNLGFIIVGVYAGYRLMKQKAKSSYAFLLETAVFFAGILLCGVGSMYYHLHPDSDTLVWDRLPMTIAFMSLFTVLLGELVNRDFAKKSFPVFLLLGFASVFYWQYSERIHAGDLRPYILVQFLPILMIPVVLLLFADESNKRQRYYYWVILGVYVLAKLAEALDVQIYCSVEIISGHSLKHVIATIAPVIFYLKQREQSISMVQDAVE